MLPPPDPPFRGETPAFDRLAKQGLKNPPTSTSRTGPSSG